MDILEKAKQFAIEAHESIQQKRKYTNEPYHYHCERIVNILREINADDNVLAAAWMHDVLEDVAPKNAAYSADKIRDLFGDHIYAMVIALTDSSLEYGNRAARKERDRLRLASASNEVKTIKLADLIDNYVDIRNNDPNFAKIFAEEIELLLPCLKGGNEILFLRLSRLLSGR